jgi:arylsulfatase A-like enzyme
MVIQTTGHSTRSGAPMAPLRNVLFIMADQLRHDCLSCYGSPRLKTPNIDALAARGTRFTNCYVQGPVCGPSRMSTYTGRYVASHGATWNSVPVAATTPTLGDHLRKAGLRVAVVGKTHVEGDRAGMARLGIDPQSERGVLLDQAGFEPYARDDGELPDRKLKKFDPPYNRYLKSLGYDANNAWHDFANSALGPNGEVLSGWALRHAGLPARVPDHHSETAWATDRAIDFIREQGEQPWCLHVSYIKPHWPYIVSAPYHAMFGKADVPRAIRSDAELALAHPVLRGFRQHAEGLAFSRDEVRETVIPAYMGLVKQIDDHLGRLMNFMAGQDRLDDTLVVFTSDHGDLLGDHWLGEKEMFYETSVKAPLIIVDPRLEGQARGRVHQGLVEAIDLLPTFMEAVGLNPANEWLEGQSLLPLTRAEPDTPRQAVFSELDYATYPARARLGVGVNAARATMVRTPRWKYVRFEGFRPQLFDLDHDADELVDLGDDAAQQGVRAEMEEHISGWRARCRNRTGISDEAVLAISEQRLLPGGVRIGEW